MYLDRPMSAAEFTAHQETLRRRILLKHLAREGTRADERTLRQLVTAQLAAELREAARARRGARKRDRRQLELMEREERAG